MNPACTFIQPMLAHDLEDDALLDSWLYAAEAKENGIRAQVHVQAGQVVAAFSRTGKPLGGPGLKWLLEKRTWATLTAILDAEVVVPGGTSSDVSHHLAAGKPLELVVFDVLAMEGQSSVDLPYLVRRHMVVDVVARFDDPRVCAVEQMTNARQAFEAAKASGREGIVLKLIEGLYEPGKRSRAWLKVKTVSTVDVVITDCASKPTKWTVSPGRVGTDGVLYPEGKLSETWQKAFVGLSYGFFDPVQGQAVRFGSLGMTGTEEELLQHVGKVAEIKVYAIEKTGRLRHPQFVRFRDDKRPEECLAPARVQRQ